METLRTIPNTLTGSPTPVTFDLKVQPLTFMGESVKNGRGETVMNDSWIYVEMPHWGLHAINVNRAKYCEKMYLSKVTIKESIPQNKLMDSELKEFIEKVSDKLVFEKFGKWYRVFLFQKTRRTFGIKKIALYKWTYDPGRKYDGVFAYNLSIDWRAAFYVR